MLESQKPRALMLKLYVRNSVSRVSSCRRIALCRKHISYSRTAAKRITKGRFEDLFPQDAVLEASNRVKTARPRKEQTTSQDPLEKAVQALSTKQASTGSVVLDTVRECTAKHPLCVLLVQVGDFYELYESHARSYAPQLDLKLTRKEVSSGVVVDFAGFPSRALERYLDILVNRLQCRVALCEQISMSTRSDGSALGFKREITRIITPGTVIEDRFLDSHAYNYLLAVSPTAKALSDGSGTIGLAWIDLSVGEFVMQKSQLESLKDDIARIQPREVILPQWMKPSNAVLDDTSYDQETLDPVTRLLLQHNSVAVTYQPDISFDASAGYDSLNSMFQNLAIESADASDEYDHSTLDDADAGKKIAMFSEAELEAAMAILTYIDKTHIGRAPKLQSPVKFSAKDTLRIDSAAIASLELVKSLRDGRRADSLLGVIDCTMTSAGSRLLSRWLLSPLTSVDAIEKRLDIVHYFRTDAYILQEIRLLLKQTTDAQRALQRLSLRRGQYSDLYDICSTLSTIKTIKYRLQEVMEENPASSTALRDLVDMLDPHAHLAQYIQKAFDYDRIESRESKDKEYGFVNRDFSPELSRLHHKLDDLFSQRSALQDRLRAACGNSLTLLSHSLFKHLIEVNASQASKLLDQCHAVLVNKTKTKHRYQVDEWTSLSISLDNTEARIVELETQVFDDVVRTLLDQSTTIVRSCRILAQLDVLVSFAWLAKQNRYVRPNITHLNHTRIVAGRHPVVETNLAKKGREFVHNDCYLGSDQRVWLLTGPNMGGKSTFLRQNAIIILLAHMGCFVPAERAEIGIADSIFSRVGAADNLAQDQSTFMVEMVETANILKHASARSIVIMDEVGRGTSTADGFSLAYAILHYMEKQIGCRALFATHYHELANMIETSDLAAIKCFMTSLHEDEYGFSFLHQVRPGVCRESHGLKVAQLAGLPPSVIDMAGHTWNNLNETQRTALRQHK
ncbi:DNA mismatch repair ATPase msh1 [Apophysomyces ossiformis]|uniref:DNA mismatch repair ATPase msh1 n=1 Tax=Apophysomyces ossiformis TaxID=679940 RepID=A0A8H7BX48_9FUNG|nr:DNA mismatch repair ATPase msh1 [Apophysomyces ossiformis]